VILLTDEQRLLVDALLSERARGQLLKKGIDLSARQSDLKPTDVLKLEHGSLIVDGAGFIWQAQISLPGEVALCPFDDRQAFYIITDAEQPEGYRTFASREDFEPRVPLRYIGRDAAAE
jgi:hypothetical protein